MNEFEMHHYHHKSGQIDTLSLKIGTPGKGGVIKVRGDADKPTEFMTRIKNAYAMRAYAEEFQSGNLAPPSYVQAAQQATAKAAPEKKQTEGPKIVDPHPYTENGFRESATDDALDEAMRADAEDPR